LLIERAICLADYRVFGGLVLHHEVNLRPLGKFTIDCARIFIVKFKIYKYLEFFISALEFILEVYTNGRKLK
jgi:hypothetical protein